jgi:phosphoribosylformylglycinamidine cyclo-ligase
MISSTIGRNKRLVPGEVIAAIIEGTEEFLEKLRQLGFPVFSAGGETADVGDLVRTIIVDSTVSARMKRSDVVDNGNIRPGDVIVGLSSSGQTVYEESYNSGMGSNGLTSARHDLLHKVYREKYPESLDPGMPEDLSYSGKYFVTDPTGIPGVDIGRLILSPTRTYAPVVSAVLGSLRGSVHGMIHCTGGGQAKVLRFIGNLRIVKENLFPLPPVFRLIMETGGTAWEEMYRVFNMGHRMEFYVPEEAAPAIISIAGQFGLEARIVGHCEPAPSKELIIRGVHGELIFR